MKTYYGTKLVKAEPMTRGGYSALSGLALPSDMVGSDDEGYLVEHQYGGESSFRGASLGYAFWMPKEQFDKLYHSFESTEPPLEGLPKPTQVQPGIETEFGYHDYLVKDTEGRLLAGIHFQEGEAKEHGVNGIHNEDLIGMVIHRLESFQRGQWPCEHNELAINALNEALSILKRRITDIE